MSKRKLGVSAVAPVNEAQQGPTKNLKKRAASERRFQRNAAKIEQTRIDAEKNTEKVVDNSPASEVSSSQVDQDSSTAITQSSNTTETKERTVMDITLTRDTKPRKSSSIVYAAPGLRSGIRVAKSAFKDGAAPETLVIQSDAFAEPKTPKAKMTPEERKAARANAPKLTLAEKIAKREEQLAKLKAKAASQPAQPSL